MITTSATPNAARSSGCHRAGSLGSTRPFHATTAAQQGQRTYPIGAHRFSGPSSAAVSLPQCDADTLGVVACQPSGRRHRDPPVEHRFAISSYPCPAGTSCPFVMSAATCQNVMIRIPRMGPVAVTGRPVPPANRAGKQQIRRPPDDRVRRMLQEQHPYFHGWSVSLAISPASTALEEPHSAAVVVTGLHFGCARITPDGRTAPELAGVGRAAHSTPVKPIRAMSGD